MTNVVEYTVVEPDDDKEQNAKTKISRETDEGDVPKTTTQIKKNTKAVATPSNRGVATTSGRPANMPYTAKDFMKPTRDSTEKPVTTRDFDAFEHFKNYIREKFCYHTIPFEKATLLETHKRIAYQVDMWTLMEKRTPIWCTRAYRGEKTLGKNVDDIFLWSNDAWQTPSTSLDGSASRTYDVEESMSKISCSTCGGTGQVFCTSCHGTGRRLADKGISTTCSRCNEKGRAPCKLCEQSGYLLRYLALKFDWYGLHSVGVYQNSFLPEKNVRRVQKKPIFYECDASWSNDPFLIDYGNLLKRIQENAAFDFVPFVHEQYQQNHFSKLPKSVMIAKMKVLIRTLDINEVEYQLEGYINSNERHAGKWSRLLDLGRNICFFLSDIF